MILEKNLYKRTNRIRNLFKITKRGFPYFWRLFFFKANDIENGLSIGAPALTLKEDGQLRCTSCLLCQDICPSFCIKIETTENSEEKPPLHFDINILRCTFCGLCQEVCPVDAIRMSGPMPMAGHSEQNWVWDKEYLSTYAGEQISIVTDDRPLLPY